MGNCVSNSACRDLLGTNKLLTADGTTISVTKVEKQNRFVLLYFCAPSSASVSFTPTLARFYNDHRENFEFEVICFSMEESDGDFQEYFTKMMPWLAVPHNLRQECRNVVKDLRIRSVPAVVILDLEHRVDGALECVVNRNAKTDIESHPEGMGFPWPDGEPTNHLAAF